MKKWKLTLILLGVLLLIGGGAFGFYQYRVSNMSIIVNGQDMTGKSAERIAQELSEEPDQVNVTITEGEETQLTGTMAEFGYGVDTEALAEEINANLEYYLGSFFQKYTHMVNGLSFEVEVTRSFDEEVYQTMVTTANLAGERISPTEGDVVFDEATGTYVVTEPEAGNEMDDEALQSSLKTALDTAALEQNTMEAVILEIPQEAYREVTLTTNSEQLHAKADVLNTYVASKIHYTFGSEVVTLDVNTFGDWISYDEASQSVLVDSEAVALYVQQMAATYNTQWKTRGFQATTGTIVTIPASNNEYGYRINESEEQTRLLADLASGTEVTREPIYNETNSYGNPYHYSRNGVDDLAGTYVEVNLTTQHLWFYKDGQLVVESDIVSGDVSEGNETITGAFPIAFKRSPYTLSSQENGYSVDVNYWMPFYDGQGLHDASWRSSFGGTIYQTDGSHGCVNLPSNVAQTIYENCEAGMAIILYQE